MKNKEHQESTKGQKEILFSAHIFIAVLMISGALTYLNGLRPPTTQQSASSEKDSSRMVKVDENLIVPAEGVVLPIEWGDLGSQMVAKGLIDAQKLEAIYAHRGGFDDEMRRILYHRDNRSLRITPSNAGFLLNLFWALGLGNKNDILEKGPMVDKQYGGPTNFASTSGWTVAKGSPMDHYSKHSFVALTPKQQQILERVSKGIYRPCCDNSTYFPDCNHGMAMLGFLELMAAQGASEEEMYKVALKVNAYWFTDTYLTIAKYLNVKRGISFGKADAKEILGPRYSSRSGYHKILKEVTPVEYQNKGACNV